VERKLFVGSYTEPGYLQPGGLPGAGVSAVALDENGRLTSVLATSDGVRNPSFLAAAGGFVYAAEELPDGSVAAMRGADLAVQSRTATGGSDPCDVLVQGPVLLAANYTSGNVAVIPASSGRLEPYVQLAGHPGTGPVSARQDASHAHQTKATEWNTVLVADLGADRVDEYAVEGRPGGVRLMLRTSAVLPPGTGPRHMVLKGSHLLVVGELDGRLHHFRRIGEHWERISAVRVFDPANPSLPADNGVQPSHIQLSADGARLFVAVRGRNSISVFDVSGIGSGNAPGTAAPDPADPRRQGPVLVAEIASGGDWPRHFLLAGEDLPAGSGRLYDANLRSNSVSVFALGGDGLPAPEPLQQFTICSPTCVIQAV